MGCKGRKTNKQTNNNNNKEDLNFKYFLYEGWNFNSGNYLFTTDTK